jgi:hypothetical protein
MRQPSKRPSANGSSGFTLAEVVKQGRKLPNRAILHSVEGWGKTSFGAQAPRPIFLMTGREDGLLTLMKSGQLPDDIPHFPSPATNWFDFKQALHELLLNEHLYQTLVIDTINGAERLCHEHVCETQYQGDWGEKGFMAFAKGYDASIPHWLEMLAHLDKLRERKGMSVLCLCHTKVETFKNPEGPDFDRYQPAMHRKTWEQTHRWADMVLFGHFEVHVDQRKGANVTEKGKARDGQTRLLMTERRASWDAKNRHGLPEEIECGASPQEAWDNFMKALKMGPGSENK